MDIDADGPEFNIRNEDLPHRLRNLILINTNGMVKSIGHGFLILNNSLQNLHIDLPALESVGNTFLVSTKSLQTVCLCLPVLKTVGEYFFKWCELLKEIYVPADQIERLEKFIPEEIRGFLRPAIA